MSDMKCPFCQQELRKIHPTYVICDNCRITGDDELWQGLIHTRKALDVAVDALKELRPTEKKSCYLVPTVFTTQKIIDEALEQITATLENQNGNC